MDVLDTNLPLTKYELRQSASGPTIDIKEYKGQWPEAIRVSRSWLPDATSIQSRTGDQCVRLLGRNCAGQDRYTHRGQGPGSETNGRHNNSVSFCRLRRKTFGSARESFEGRG